MSANRDAGDRNDVCRISTTNSAGCHRRTTQPHWHKCRGAQSASQSSCSLFHAIRMMIFGCAKLRDVAPIRLEKHRNQGVRLLRPDAGSIRPLTSTAPSAATLPCLAALFQAARRTDGMRRWCAKNFCGAYYELRAVGRRAAHARPTARSS